MSGCKSITRSMPLLHTTFTLRAFVGALIPFVLFALVAWQSARASEARVPYVPTPQPVVDRMLEIAKVGAQDYLIDLGSGDGRIVVTAAQKYGARGFGVDLNPVRIQEAEDNAKRAGVTDRAAFYQRDLFETDLSSASVITMYLLPQVNLELRPRLLELKPGTRIVSHDFSMGDWKPDQQESIIAERSFGGASDVYLWIIPARVSGAWRSQFELRSQPVQYEIAINQQFQMFSGTARAGGRTVKLANGRLDGDTIRFEFTAEVAGAPVKHVFTGKVYGDTMSGTADLSGAKLQSKVEWSAKRS